ncbi:hypothetical protein RJT34_12939 [Clitoria ternatea]|uniref:Uncharacterized protein n=1 Tax=Clitoria ternatea TaxID=43366 RepID=A0AAN9PJT1_CLITE
MGVDIQLLMNYVIYFIGKFKPMIKKAMVELKEDLNLVFRSFFFLYLRGFLLEVGKLEEVDLLYDVQHWETLSDSEKHFITYDLAFFAASDGIVFGEFGCKARAFYGLQIAMGNIHSGIELQRRLISH